MWPNWEDKNEKDVGKEGGKDVCDVIVKMKNAKDVGKRWEKLTTNYGRMFFGLYLLY